MSARRRNLRRVSVPRDPAKAVDLWWQAVDLRAEWLDHALCSAPADRAAAENAIAGLYALLDRAPPTFIWADSPDAAAKLIPPSKPLFSDGRFPLQSRMATLEFSLRERLNRRTGRPRGEHEQPYPDPVQALLSGESLRSVLDDGVRGTLRRAVRESIAGLIRAALPPGVGLNWYGQHDVDWVAHYDVHRRVAGTLFDAKDVAQLELWATLARSCGWWWVRDDACVLSERPLATHTETAGGERRLHNPDGPAVVYPDGWAVHAWHGTRVPSWVIDGPTVDLIAAEGNVEVRRCAIERMGWAAFIDQAGLELIRQAADPGNPGCELRLYDLPHRHWGAPARLLLAVNGSVERDGTRRQYGLHVPPWFDDPIDAAGWTYGLSGAQYAQLRRRT
jgi:hypothetical protein